MPIESVAFTVGSLQACLSQTLNATWFDTFECPPDGAWSVVSVTVGQTVYVLERGASVETPLIIIRLGKSGLFGAVPASARLHLLQRVHRLALQAQARNISLPHPWSSYQAGNKITFFAYPAEYGNDRIIAQILTTIEDARRNVVVWELTTESSQIPLEHYSPHQAIYRTVCDGYSEAIQRAAGMFTAITDAQPTDVIDLEAASYGAVSQGVRFSSWLERLTTQQRRFVEHPPDRSLKLRGPAGSGKTLALQLKALWLLYRAWGERVTPRILYVTHSWTVADQAQRSLETMDERGLARHLDVFPLLTLAETSLPPRPPGYTVLGEDSHSGKANQLRVISTTLAEFVETEWVAYRGSCAPAFIKRVEAEQGSVEHDTFLWDLMLEFSCVISPNGIFPGVNALQRYLKIRRMRWMMPLENQQEKQTVMSLYTAYIRRLEADKHLTSDQIIGDYLNSLATFRWHAMRREHGYDYIFVDELHLFNEQERFVFHQLTRDPDAPPKIFMALDPRQSPAETYAEFQIADTAIGESGLAAKTFGRTQDIDLREIHRYTPEILAFVKHLDAFFPTVDLGGDWGLSLADAESKVGSGSVPTLYRHAEVREERRSVLYDALEERRKGARVAVLCVRHDDFDNYLAAVSVSAPQFFQVIQSRDDVEQLRYSKRKIVISTPEFVAGLQFDTVILAGLEARFSQNAPYQAYELRRFLSELYLGASRAIKVLHIHFTDAGSGLPQVIESALNSGLLVLPGGTKK
jgi:hypothetical protein